MVQEEFNTGMYVVDREFRIVNFNRAMARFYPEVKIGDHCYKSIALRDTQCDLCPLKTDNALFYNPVRKEWIFANAAEMEYPGHGNCYNVQFQLRQKITEPLLEAFHEENMDEHLVELSGGSSDVCAIGGYCDLGSPLFYANDQLLRLLGYTDFEDMSADVDGLVSNTIHPDDLERATKDLTRCAQQGGTFETTYRMHRKDRSWFWVVSRGKRIEIRSGIYALLSVITDMTEFMKRQSELREQNEKLLKQELTSNAVLEHMPGGYHRCANAPGFPFLYFGSSFESITGWSKEEIIDEFDNRFANMVLPEDIPLCQRIVDAIETNGYSNAIYRLKKKGGGYIWVSDSSMRLELDGESFYHGVLADVTAQITELEQARHEAEASNLAKSTFLFNVSHDIRTPMNAIQGFAHIIASNKNDPVRVEDAVRKLKIAGETLLTLMNDVLELSRIERGKEIVSLRPVDLIRVTEQMHDMIASDMEDNGITFHVENSVRHPYVMTDELKLTRIAMNLLSNARKFTPQGGTVVFGIKEDGYDGTSANYSLYVRDNGIGMSEEFRQRAFEQFERERSSTDSGVSGSGLGLAIIKKIIDLLGGTCEIHSTRGIGTEVICTVSCAVSQSHTETECVNTAQTDFSGRRLLLVEDNDFNREIAHYVFENFGFLVEEAVDGAACLDQLKKVPCGYYDLILMDIQMPVMDGYAATAEIRRSETPCIAEIPIIAMTANAFEEDRKRCLEVGMDGHIAKPLDEKAVLTELMRVLHL